jgi:glycosyltransferase involved in cell wall biosynthesis
MADKKLNIIVVCGSLYLRNNSQEACSSGSDICLEEEIYNISPYSNQIYVVALSRKGLPPVEDISKNVKVHRVSEEKVKDKIEKIHHNKFEQKTDYLITQLLLCDIAIKKAKELKIPIVYFMHSFGNDLELAKGQQYEPDKFIVCTEHMKKVADEKYNLDTIVNPYSFNGYRKVVADKKIVKDYNVLMFNPVVVKGGKILISLVKTFPQLKFLSVLGWQELKNGEDYDLQLMRLMSSAHGSDELHIPQEVDLTRFSNLKVIPPEPNPGNIIQRAELLIVPSQWEEAFGRVIVEAGLNNRLVMASNQSGIPEAMKIAGMPKKYMDILLIDDYKDPKAWERNLKLFFEYKDEIPNPSPNVPKSKLKKILLGQSHE